MKEVNRKRGNAREGRAERERGGVRYTVRNTLKNLIEVE